MLVDLMGSLWYTGITRNHEDSSESIKIHQSPRKLMKKQGLYSRILVNEEKANLDQ
jgi:hypothetical protein